MEEQQTAPDFSQIPSQAIRVITDPVGFYRDMPKSGGFLEPLVFLVVMALVAGVVMAILSLIGLGGPMGGFGTAGFAAIVMVPIGALIGGFIGAAILYVIWMLMGSKESYETAFRCIAYASAIYPVLAVVRSIPYLGGVIGVLWGLFLMVVASEQVHKIAKNTAYVVFGIIALILVVMNVGAERTARKFMASGEHISESMMEQAKRMEDMTPEEAGKAVGEFLKGLEQAAEGQKEE